MLTNETHAAEKFPTPPNTFLMVRFQCCFSMNIISVIQFVLKVFCSFSLSTVVKAKFMSSICIDLGAHSFFPTPHPFKIYLRLVTMAYCCATFARRVMKYTTPDKWKSSRRTGKHASKFFHGNSFPPSFRTRRNWKSGFLKCTAVGTVFTAVSTAATLVSHRILLLRLFLPLLV